MVSCSGEEGLAPNVALSYVTNQIRLQKPTRSWRRVEAIGELNSLNIYSFHQEVDQYRRAISILYVEVIVINMKHRSRSLVIFDRN